MMHPFQRRTIAILILLVAATLRLYALDSLPPGLNFDEAGNGVAALDILAGESRLWWRIGGGKEPLWPYLIAVSTTVLGPQPLALRLPAALVGILTVAAAYPLGVALFRTYPARHTIALVLMMGIATSGWHVHFSRLGFRAILLPLLAMLAFYFFWRATKPLSMLAASLCLALTMYAYLAGRLLPLVPVLFVIGLLMRRQVEPFFTRLMWLTFGTTIFLIPLIAYFTAYPEDLMARVSTVSIFNPASNQGDIPGTAWHIVIQTMGTFIGLTGDTNPLVNLPGDPAVPLVLAPFFGVGLGFAAWHSLRDSGAGLFVLLWGLVMLLPALLAPEAPPHHLRLIGTLPAIYIFIALGVVMPLSLLISRFRPRLLWLASLIALALFGYVTVHTATAYFVRWPNSTDFTLPYDLYAVRLADDIRQAAPGEVYVLAMDLRAADEARHYTLDYLLPDDAPYVYLLVDEFAMPQQLTRLADQYDTFQVVRWTADKHLAADEKQLLTFLLETHARRLEAQTYPVYTIETYTDFSTPFDFPGANHQVTATFDGLLRLDAAYVPATAVPGETLPVAVTLSPLQPMDTDYKISVRLVNIRNERFFQLDRTLRHNYHQGTALWPDESVNEYFLLPLAPDIPTGSYMVMVVIYHPDTLGPLISDGLVEVGIRRLFIISN